MELNLETIFQLTGKLVLIALVESETRTTQGLLTIFEESDLFGIPAEMFIVISVVFSFASFAFAQTNGIAGCRIYFPLRSRLLIGCSALLASGVRVMTFLLYFSPCLGLLNLLRHYQAEQLGFYKTNEDLASQNLFGDQWVPQIIPNVFKELYVNQTEKPINISLIQRGNWTNSFMEYVPPDVEEYTYFRVKQYFYIFWAILIVHGLTLIIVKNLVIKQFKKLPFYEKIFHIMECVNFAFPYRDWDHENDDAHQHYLRMVAAKKEVQINLLINTIFNLILLFPLPLLYNSIAERHDILSNSIGTLELENEAFNQAWLFSWIFFVVTIVCAVLQYACFHFYNDKYHPMAVILMESRSKNESIAKNGFENNGCSNE